MEGEKLQPNGKIAILEAMKMEIDVVVPDRLYGAVVEKLLVKPGDTVDSGQPLLVVRMPKDMK
jgi:biotin carboxyl carrier protein